MADSSNLFPLLALSRVEVDSVTSQATGFPIELGFDFNPDTCWKPTSTANQTIDIDMGGNYTIGAFGLFVRNYTTDHDNSGSAQIAVSYDESDSFPSPTAWKTLVFQDAGSTSDPIYIVTETSVIKRYWRMLLSGMATTLEVAQFLFCRHISLSHSNQYPEQSEMNYGNVVSRDDSGRTWVKGRNFLVFDAMFRQWTGLTETVFNSLKLALDESRESRYPMIYNEGSSYWMVKARNKSFKWWKIQHDMYYAEVIFERMPYMYPGKNY